MIDEVDSSGGMMKTMMAIMMIAIMGSIIGTLVVSAAPAPPATPQFICPICDEAFYTLAELEAHFALAHPSTPIDIIWD